jgi:hypothetical protein
MAQRIIDSTFEQDMAALGLSTMVEDQRTLAGMNVLTEDSVVGGGVKRLDTIAVSGTTQTEDHDPIDGPVVTRELFNRIAALPFESMDAGDIDALLEELGKKDLPEGDAALTARAQEVVEMLLRAKGRLEEGSAFRTFGAKSGKMVTKHRRTDTKGRKARLLAKQYRRTHKSQIKRSTKKMQAKAWYKKVQKVRAAKMGAKGNKLAARIAAKPIRKLLGAGNRGPVRGFSSLGASADSEIANDLRSVLHESRVQAGSRAEIVERLNNIFALMSEMYGSPEVDAVLEEALIPVIDRANAGTLVEDALNEDEFVATLAPCFNLVTRIMESIEDGEIDFDYLGEDIDEDDEDDEDESGN